MSKRTFRFSQDHWVPWCKLRNICFVINYESNDYGKRNDEASIISKLFILYYLLHLAFEREIAKYKIAPCQKHEKNDNILYQWLIVPIGDTRIFRGEPTRR